ncbi:MAG TPA: VCBS repeat-containing protein [Puia sp.]|nr:VCBS repeat-containing protein [Puia sp.]
MNSKSTLLKVFVVLSTVICLITPGCANSVNENNSGFNIRTIKTNKNPGSVELADFNNDGLPDIVLANTADSSVTILLGNGKGEFSASPGSPFFSNRFPNDIAIADFNKDGNLDLGIANTEVSFLTVLLGNGKGQFEQAPKSPFKVSSKPHTHGIATGDFNGDGNLDLATDSWGENKILIIFGDGKGNFGGQISFRVGNRPYQRLRAADLNKDGIPDIVTSNLEGNNATVLLAMGEGKFQEAPGSPFPSGDAPFGIAIGDVNADNNQDIAIVNSPTITAESKGKDGLYILMGDGSGKFAALKGSPFKTGKSPSRLAIGDLNADGINDIAVTNYNDKSITIFYMSKNGVDKTEIIPVGNRPDGIAIHDLNGDGKNDIAVSNFDDNTLIILFQK